MTRRESDWQEYKAMFLDDREQNRVNFAKITDKLDEISNSLAVLHTERKTERKIGVWAAGIILPAVVALAVTGVAHAFGW